MKDSARADDSGGGTSEPVGSRASGSSASSAMASGLPPVSAWTRASHASVTGVVDNPSAKVRAAPLSSPPRTSRSRPSTRSSASPARPATSIATGSEPSRRAAKTSALADGRSSRWTSSSSTATGASSAYRHSRLSVAAPIANLSPAGPSARARAAERARDCGGAIVSRRPSAGRSTARRPANGTSCSGSVPVARRMRKPSRRPSAQRSSAVLPTPGSPVTASTPLAPILAPETSRSMVRCSCSRPISTRRV